MSPGLGGAAAAAGVLAVLGALSLAPGASTVLLYCVTSTALAVLSAALASVPLDGWDGSAGLCEARGQRDMEGHSTAVRRYCGTPGLSLFNGGVRSLCRAVIFATLSTLHALFHLLFVEREPAASYLLLIHCAVVTLRIFTVLGAKTLQRRAKLRPRRLMLGGWVPCS